MNIFRLLTVCVMGATLSGGPASATEIIDTGKFIAFPTAGTTNAIGPELQLDAQRRIFGIIRPHLDHISMEQTAKSGNAPTDYAGNFKGMAAGDMGQILSDKVSIWGSVNRSRSENDFRATAYDSDTLSASFGLDYAATDKFTWGAFLSFSDTDTDSKFNGGDSDTDAITFAPVFSLLINDVFTVDGSIGYTKSDIDNKRTVGAVVAKGSQDGDSVFASVNLNAQKWNGNWGFGGRLGYSYYDTDNDSYTDSLGTAFSSTDSQLGQVQVGAKVSYYTPGAMYFFGITYINDVESEDVTTTTPPQPDNDDDEVSIELGISLFGNDPGPLSGGITANYSTERSDYDAWGVGGYISYKF